MENSKLTPIQKEIVKALEQSKNKSLITEAELAKKIRQNINFTGKPKAGLSLEDLEIAISFLEESQSLFYSAHCNSANDLFFRKDLVSKPLDHETKQRRLKSEKNITILTSRDITENSKSKKDPKSQKKTQPKRTERKTLNIYGDYDEE